MLAVKILQPYPPYEPGHVVDLPDALAQSLIESGTCRAYNSPVLPAEVATTQNDPTATSEGGTTV
jgi:hypothetical protein